MELLSSSGIKFTLLQSGGYVYTAGGRAPALSFVVSPLTILCLTGRYFSTNSFMAVSVSALISADGSGCMNFILSKAMVVFCKVSFVMVPKSWEYCKAVNVSCLKWETA